MNTIMVFESWFVASSVETILATERSTPLSILHWPARILADVCRSFAVQSRSFTYAGLSETSSSPNDSESYLGSAGHSSAGGNSSYGSCGANGAKYRKNGQLVFRM